MIGEEPYELGLKSTFPSSSRNCRDIRVTRMAMPVRVVHCQRDLSPEYYIIGLAFSLVTEQQKEIIEAIIENYEFRRQTPDYPPRPA